MAATRALARYANGTSAYPAKPIPSTYDADIERLALEGSPFEDLHDWPDGVIAAQVMVEPQFVDSVVPVTVEELDAG